MTLVFRYIQKLNICLIFFVSLFRVFLCCDFKSSDFLCITNTFGFVRALFCVMHMWVCSFQQRFFFVLFIEIHFEYITGSFSFTFRSSPSLSIGLCLSLCLYLAHFFFIKPYQCVFNLNAPAVFFLYFWLSFHIQKYLLP